MINQIDSALFRFLNSPDRSDSESGLAELVADRIEPIVARTLRARLGVSLRTDDASRRNQDALELFADIRLQIIAELGKLRSDPNGREIQNLGGYVAAVALNAYRQYLRSKYPNRNRLKNQLRYLVSHHPEFEMWDEGDRRVCGFRRDRRASAVPGLDCDHLIAQLGDRDFGGTGRLADLVAAVFEAAGGPVRLADLVSVAAGLSSVTERLEIAESEHFSIENSVAAQVRDHSAGFEQADYLRAVWEEIRSLPLRHRRALMLNLKDRNGNSAIFLLPLLRIASVRVIADALEFGHEEFAAIWNELPWDDRKIADNLGLTRQQVINLRQSARLRLVRGLAGKK